MTYLDIPIAGTIVHQREDLDKFALDIQEKFGAGIVDGMFKIKSEIGYDCEIIVEGSAQPTSFYANYRINDRVLKYSTGILIPTSAASIGIAPDRITEVIETIKNEFPLIKHAYECNVNILYAILKVSLHRDLFDKRIGDLLLFINSGKDHYYDRHLIPHILATSTGLIDREHKVHQLLRQIYAANELL